MNTKKIHKYLVLDFVKTDNHNQEEDKKLRYLQHIMETKFNQLPPVPETPRPRKRARYYEMI